MSLSDVEQVEERLARRLRTVAALLAPGSPVSAGGGPIGGGCAAEVMEELAGAVKHELTPERVWALLGATWAALPTMDDVQEALRLFELSSPRDIAIWTLDGALDRAPRTAAFAELQIVTGRVVVDVGLTARSTLHTGIQQVVRRTLPLWDRSHPVEAVAWTKGGLGWRSLAADESSRALRWHEPPPRAAGDSSPPLPLDPGGRPPAPASDRGEDTDADPADLTVVLPWRTVTVLMEVPQAVSSQRVAALGRYSGNRVVAVGYDCIPVVSGDMMPRPEAPRFTRYLSALKYAHRVAAISGAAATQFAGFSAAVASQGLPGPVVTACPLGADPDGPVAPAPEPAPVALGREAPVVLSVGSFEPRKNHLALLHASETLWREGLDFRLLLIGGSGWGDELPARISALQATGRPVEVRNRVGDEALLEAYRSARFTVFASLHEGFGLPVAESLAAGTPVITSAFGSTAEVARGGGALLVDPRDDTAITDAMRTLLTDDGALADLRGQVAARPRRSWADYAGQLWEVLVAPELATFGAEP